MRQRVSVLAAVACVVCAAPAAGQVTSALVSVSGKATLNGRAFAGRQITFSARTASTPNVVTTTDDEGGYRASLSQPGEYLVIIGEYLVIIGDTFRQATFTAGDNTLDLALTGGILRVAVVNARDEAQIEVRLEGSMSTTRAVAPQHVWEPLPLGRYQVSAKSGATASEVVDVELTAARPETSVTLRLEGSDGVLDVHGADGGAVSAVAFAPARPEVIEAGRLYALRGIAPGTELRIRAAGWAPVCRRLPHGGNLSVTLTRGRPLHLQFANAHAAAMARLFASVSGADGSDCAVRLWDFAFISVADSPERLAIENFAVAPGAVLITSGGSFTLTPGADGIVRIPR